MSRRALAVLAAGAAALVAAAAAFAATVVVAPGHMDGWAVNNDTCGAATTTRTWNQPFGSGAGVTGCSYFPGCSALSFCHE